MSEMSSMFVYVGTYTAGNESKGIYVYDLDLASGALEPRSTASGVVNPSFLELHPNGQFLYAIGETGGNGKGGTVAAYAIDTGDGALTLLNSVSSVGSGPCHLSIDATGAYAFVANYAGGSVCMLPIGADGRLGEASDFIQHAGTSVDPGRQQGPHAHSINVDPGNRFVFVPDLGLDKILIYEIDFAAGKLTPASQPWTQMAPGAGPRHFDFHPSREFAYVINEIDNTIAVFGYDQESGTIEELQVIDTLPADFDGVSHTADVHVDASGKFLYGSNRGHDSIAIYAIDVSSGQLSLIGHESTRGSQPRNFGIDPTGAWLLAANHQSDTIFTFAVGPEAGTLSSTGDVVKLPAPVCVKFLVQPGTSALT